MTSDLRPITVHTGTADQNGRLVMIDGRLVAVIVQLADRVHGDDTGRWNIEATFNLFDRPDGTFASATDAELWIRTRFVRQATRKLERPPSPVLQQRE